MFGLEFMEVRLYLSWILVGWKLVVKKLDCSLASLILRHEQYCIDLVGYLGPHGLGKSS